MGEGSLRALVTVRQFVVVYTVPSEDCMVYTIPYVGLRKIELLQRFTDAVLLSLRVFVLSGGMMHGSSLN